MKLYFYSSDDMTFIEAPRAWSLFIFGILVVAMVTCFGGLAILQAGQYGTKTRSAASLTIENDIMSYQLQHFHARLSKLDREAEQLEALFQIQGQLIGYEKRLRLSASDQSIVVVHIPSDRTLLFASRSGL